MGKLTTEKPFTELVERTREVARIDSDNDRSRARGAVNHAYTQKVPREEDWTVLLATSSIPCTPRYNTGLATATTQSTTVSFSGAALTAAMTGRRIKFAEEGNVYAFTYVNASTGTISPQLSGTRNITGGAFDVFQPVYSLAADFERFKKESGPEYWTGGRPATVRCVDEYEFKRDYSAVPGIPSICRLVTSGTDGLQAIELSPPPKDAIHLPYEYLRKLAPLRESTAGVITIDAGSTVVVGSAGTTRFTEAQVGWYLRVDAHGTGEDSEWYRILGLTHNSSLTLQSAFGPVAATTAPYTLAAAPALPAMMHDAIWQSAVMSIAADQNDPLFKLYDAEYGKVISDAKRLYKSRQYNRHTESDLEDYNFRR